MNAPPTAESSSDTPKPPAKCLALFSGGLDSMLAVKMMQEQGIEVEALNFKTLFTCCQDQAGQAAHKLGVPLTVLSQEEDYLDLVRKPSFGYGRAANPCIDCRVYMFQKAKVYMEEAGASFVVSGEVIGQRPKSQKRRDLEVISHHSQLDDLLLRPLCAKRLPPTKPERDGVVDRDRLGNFVGRSRKGLIRLAKHYGLTDIPAPSTGCQLTEPRFSRKVFDLMKHEPSNESWAFELLKYGRHFRWDEHTKFVVGRNESDNESLMWMQRNVPDPSRAVAVRPYRFPGPVVLVTGDINEASLDAAASMVLEYSRLNDGISDMRDGQTPVVSPNGDVQVEVCQHQTVQPRWATRTPAVTELHNIATVRTRC